jgi:low affinity Fe/Cu permease
MKTLFRKFAEKISQVTGTPWAFLAALAILVAWAGSGPFFNFSAQWQLVVNSVTTIVTFLMVFLIQNTQNRDFKALQLKLDILIYASDDTHPGLINLHKFSDEDIKRLEHALKRLRGRHDIETILQALEKSDANPVKA